MFIGLLMIFWISDVFLSCWLYLFPGRAEVIWHRSGKSDLASIWFWDRSGDCSIKRADLANLDLAKKFRSKPYQKAYPHVIMVDLENKPIWIERAIPEQCNNVGKSQCVSNTIGIWSRSGKNTRSGIDCVAIIAIWHKKSDLEDASIGNLRPIWL